MIYTHKYQFFVQNVIDFLVTSSKQGMENHDAFRGSNLVQWHHKSALSIKLKSESCSCKRYEDIMGVKRCCLTDSYTQFLIADSG